MGSWVSVTTTIQFLSSLTSWSIHNLTGEIDVNNTYMYTMYSHLPNIYLLVMVATKAMMACHLTNPWQYLLGCSNDQEQGGSQNWFFSIIDTTGSLAWQMKLISRTPTIGIILCLAFTNLTSDDDDHGDGHRHGCSRMLALVCGKHVLHGARELHSLLGREPPPLQLELRHGAYAHVQGPLSLRASQTINTRSQKHESRSGTRRSKI